MPSLSIHAAAHNGLINCNNIHYSILFKSSSFINIDTQEQTVSKFVGPFYTDAVAQAWFWSVTIFSSHILLPLGSEPGFSVPVSRRVTSSQRCCGWSVAVCFFLQQERETRTRWSNAPMRQLMMHSTVPTEIATATTAIGVDGHSGVEQIFVESEDGNSGVGQIFVESEAALNSQSKYNQWHAFITKCMIEKQKSIGGKRVLSLCSYSHKAFSASSILILSDFMKFFTSYF